MSLPNPFPTKWNQPPVAHFYMSVLLDGELHRRLSTIGFAQLYAAKRWLETAMGDEKAIRVGHELVLESSGIRIRCYELDKVLDYEYRCREEERWQLPVETARMIARFRKGTWFTELGDDKIDEKKVVIKRAKVSVEVKTRTVKPEGYVTITELCKGTKILPMNARALLRTVMAKPEYGWAFDPKRIPEIRKLIGAL